MDLIGNEPYNTNIAYNPNTRFYTLDVNDIATSLKTSVKSGLSEGVIMERATKYGRNVIEVGGKRSALMILAGHVLNVVTFVLIAVVIITAVFAQWVKVGFVSIIIVFNSGLGFYQEWSSEKTLEALKDMTKGTAHVLRDGKAQIISIDDVVLGDVVLLEQGAVVPCDIRLAHVTNLEIDEALLTGEALPVRKVITTISDPNNNCSLGDRKNSAYRQTTVSNGKGYGIAVAVGMSTELGKMTEKLSDNSEVGRTALQQAIDKMMYILTALALVSVIIVFAVNRFDGSRTTILYSAAVVIAILPESLVAVITIAMTIGVRRMAEKKCIVRKLSALERLGKVTDICSDKTGTLTENKMVCKKMLLGTDLDLEIFTAPTSIHATFRGEDTTVVDVKKEATAGTMREFFEAATLCGSTELHLDDTKEAFVPNGNPTEVAIQALGWKAGTPRQEVMRRGWVFEREFPFDSSIKRMATAYDKGSITILFVKGAPERVLELCNTKRQAKTGEVEPLTDNDREVIMERLQQYCKLGLRCILFASRTEGVRELLSVAEPSRKDLEDKLTYLGAVGIYDPPRPESAPSVAFCRQAHITVRMLTGDHQDTATAIAKQIGILQGEPEPWMVMTGPQIDKMSPEEIDKLTPDLPLVIGRCSPDAKVRIVESLKRRGKIAAMTGDGFNDSMSIKASDVGCAMGSGTDVTKGVADLIITDDNFHTIVAAITEGRRIVSTLSKVIIHLLGCNMAEMTLHLVGLAVMYPHNSIPLGILSPLGILWVNVFTGSPPSTGISTDLIDPRLLRLPPGRIDIFSKELVIDILVYGVLLGGLSLGAFIVVAFGFDKISPLAKDCLDYNSPNCSTVYRARATCIATITLLLQVHAYNVRRPRSSLFKTSLIDNKWLVGTVAFGVLSLFPMIYAEPVAKYVFIHEMLTWEWAVVIIAVLIFFVCCELYKIAKNHFYADPLEAASENAIPVVLSANASIVDIAHSDLTQTFRERQRRMSNSLLTT